MRFLWLAITTPTRAAMLTEGMTEDERAAYEAHTVYLDSLRERGVLVLAGRTDEAVPRGLEILRADGAAEARAVIAADPFVARGVVSAEVVPYRLAHLYPENAGPGPEGPLSLTSGAWGQQEARLSAGFSTVRSGTGG